MSAQAGRLGGGAASSSAVPGSIADIYAAFCEHAPACWTEDEKPKRFQTAQNVLRRAGIKLPFSGPELEAALRDPGAARECMILMDIPTASPHATYARDSPEVLEARSWLQQAAFFARAPRGFASIERSPELAAVVSRCCYELLDDCARDKSDSYTGKEVPLLLWLLTPAHRVCLLAEVAAAFCCPGQPLPPNTPEHCAALLAFIQTAARHARHEGLGLDTGALRDAKRRAVHLVGYVHRNAWPQPQQALVSLTRSAFLTADAVCSQIAMGRRISHAEGEALVVAMSCMLAQHGRGDALLALQALAPAWGHAAEKPWLHAQPADSDSLTSQLLEACAKLNSEDCALNWKHRVDALLQGQQHVQMQPSHSTSDTASSSSSGRNGTATASSSSSSSSGSSSSSSSKPGQLPAGHAALCLQMQALGLALIWRFVVRASSMGGTAAERCPQQLAQLLIAHQSAFGQARLHAWLAPQPAVAGAAGTTAGAAAQAAEAGAQPASSSPAGVAAVQATEAETEAAEAGFSGRTAVRRRWGQRRRQQQQEQQDQQDQQDQLQQRASSGAAFAQSVLSFLQLLRRFEQEDDDAAAATAGATAAAEPAHSDPECKASWKAPWWQQSRQHEGSASSRQPDAQQRHSTSCSTSNDAPSRTRAANDSRSGSTSRSSMADAELPHELRGALADCLAYADRTAQIKKDVSQGKRWGDDELDQIVMQYEHGLVGRRTPEALRRVPLVDAVIAERDRAMQCHQLRWQAYQAVMAQRESAEQPCALCEAEEQDEREQQHLEEEQRQQQRQEQEQQQRQQQQGVQCASHEGPCTAEHCCVSSSSCAGDGAAIADHSSCGGDTAASGTSSSNSCADGTAAGSSSSHGSSARQQSQPPDPASPFLWRKLVWQLLERLKPSAAAALRLQGGCPHVDDSIMWNDIRNSIEHTLLPLEHGPDRGLFLCVAPRSKDAALQQRVVQYARAITAKFVQGGEASAIAGLLSANLLMVLDPFEDALLPQQSLMEWWPSSYSQLLGRFLVEQMERLEDPMLSGSHSNFAKLPLLWHLHMRQQGGGDYSNMDARCAALKAAFAQLLADELPAVARRRPYLPQAVWQDPALAALNPAKLTNIGPCESMDCPRDIAQLTYKCGLCGCAAYCSDTCMEADAAAHRATACRQLARARRSPQLWRVLGWLQPQQLQAMTHMAYWDLNMLLGRQGQQQQERHLKQQQKEQQRQQEQGAAGLDAEQQHGLAVVWAAAHVAVLHQADKLRYQRRGRVPESSRNWHLRALVGLPTGVGGCPGVVTEDDVAMVIAYFFNQRLQLGKNHTKSEYQRKVVSWIE